MTGARLLVVDDNENNRVTLTRRLARLGYRDVTVAEHGRQALDLIEREAFDLVLLDVMMPEMNGYEVLERLRAAGRLRDLPVVVISAVDEMDSIVRCIELGAEDYLPKPFNPTLLRARVGASLEKKRLRDAAVAHLGRVEGELRFAREIQLSMVPTVFPAPTAERPAELAAVLEPAREVGGDLYDVFDVDGRLHVVVADVSDKGVPAALFMARAKAVVRLLATLLRGPDGAAPDPAETLRRVNVELARDNPHCMFVTLFLGVLDPARGQLAFVSAGHPMPLVVGAAGPVRVLDGPKGKPLGIREDLGYAAGQLAFERGDTLLVVTDGITEAVNDGGELFGDERLAGVLTTLAGKDPTTVVDAVLAAVRAFSGAAGQADDIAALALRWGA